MNEVQRQRILHTLRRLNWWLDTLKVLCMLLAIVCLLAIVIPAIDYYIDNSDYTKWQELVTSDNYVVATDSVHDIGEVCSPVTEDGFYGVAYTGSIAVGTCRSLLYICNEAGVSDVVTFQVAMPNGVLYWGKLSIYDLMGVVLEADMMYLNDDDVYSFDSPPQRIQTGIGAWIHAKVYRCYQNYAIKHHATIQQWSNAMIITNLSALAVNVLVYIWLLNKIQRAKYRNEQTLKREIQRESAMAELVQSHRTEPSMIFFCNGMTVVPPEEPEAPQTTATAETEPWPAVSAGTTASSAQTT